MDVLSVCPMLIVQNEDQTEYRGYLTASDQDFQLNISLPGPGRVQGARVDCEWRLKHLLRGYEAIVQQRLQQCSTLAEFLVELKSIVERQLQNEPRIDQSFHTELYGALIGEIEQLGWDRLAYVDTTFQELHLVVNDGNNRQHLLKIKLHSQHPREAPTCTVDLPLPFTFAWTEQKQTLRDLFVQFERHVSLHQDLWDQLDQVDSNTWVLEPEKPTRGATMRRIALANNGSLQVQVDPKQPRMLPECKFLGADHVINPLRESLNSNLHNWNPDETLLRNLEVVLGVSFPSPVNTKKEDFSMECGICYAYRLDSHIPDQVCEDPRCGQPFHHACLYEWLRALASSRQSFNTVFGECPYCNKPITVKMPTR